MAASFVQAPATGERSAACRLCGGTAHELFRRRLLVRHDVAFFECEACGSLEVETPHWLAEAYADDAGAGTNNLSDLDTGAAQRNLTTAAATLTVARVLGLRNVVDFGGGDGLLCRLLRDYGLNAYVSDRYAMATYGRGFTKPDFARPDLVTAFEVLEHFADPREEVAQLFAGDPAAVLVSTELYHRQGDDWWYLSLQTGQHVFFYSERAMQLLAERFGYALARAGSFTLFVKPSLSGARTRLLRQMLRYRPLKLARAVMAYRDGPGVGNDLGMLKQRNDAIENGAHG